jgi:hypothetical protein
MISSRPFLLLTHFAMRACYYVVPFSTHVPSHLFIPMLNTLFLLFSLSLVYPVQSLICVV